MIVHAGAVRRTCGPCPVTQNDILKKSLRKESVSYGLLSVASRLGGGAAVK